MKEEGCLPVMRSSGGASEFSSPIRVMQKPRLMQWSEVAAAEFERSCGCMKEEDEEGSEGENEKDPCPYL